MSNTGTGATAARGQSGLAAHSKSSLTPPRVLQFQPTIPNPGKSRNSMAAAIYGISHTTNVANPIINRPAGVVPAAPSNGRKRGR